LDAYSQRGFYATNNNISNARLKRDLGVELAYPTYREGLEQLGMRAKAVQFDRDPQDTQEILSATMEEIWLMRITA
jgi:hypothetical protein